MERHINVVLTFNGTFGGKVCFHAAMRAGNGQHRCPGNYQHQGNSNHRWQLYYDRARFALFSKCFANGKNNKTCARNEVRLGAIVL